MISIRKLDNADDKYITTLAKLHMTAFPNFFLTQLGLPFLKTLYRGYMEDENSGIIVAEINGKLAGFIAYSNEYSEFYKGLLKRRLIQFAFCSLLAVIKHPFFFKRLLGAFKKSDDAKKEEATLSATAARYAGQCIYELREKADVVDQRYLFF